MGELENTALESEAVEELAPEVTGEEVPTSPEANPDSKSKPEDDLQRKIAEKSYKLRVAEREAESLRKRVAEFEQTQQARPVVPALPDALTVNTEVFQQHLAQRDTAIRQAAEYDAQQTALKAQQQASETARQQAQHEELVKQAQTYTARAVQLGLKPDELQAAGKLVGEFGVHPEIATMILADDHGPLITKYLASNLQELDDLSRLPVTQQAVRIATLIKTKAASLKPRVSNAPDPLNPVRGGGLPPADFGPKGATYE